MSKTMGKNVNTSIGNGSLPIPLRGNKFFRVYGGPYLAKPEGMFGVKMAREIRAHEVNVDIPTPDFDVPPAKAMEAGLEVAVDAVLAGFPIYVGCFAGKGRTGLFLAVLCRAFGIEAPVEYVRKHYYPHAVETAKQYDYVTKYKFSPELLARIQKARSPWNFQTWFKKELTKSPVI